VPVISVSDTYLDCTHSFWVDGPSTSSTAFEGSEYHVYNQGGGGREIGAGTAHPHHLPP
jgi:hypothetical protein